MIDGVHEHAILAVVDEDEQPPEDADLRRREPDAVGLVHERRHALDEPLEVVVERLDLPRLHPQNGVAVLPDPRERERAAAPPARAPARPRASSCVVLVVVIVIVVVVVVVVGHRAASLARRAMAGLVRLRIRVAWRSISEPHRIERQNRRRADAVPKSAALNR